jgi:hypothetical protein
MHGLTVSTLRQFELFVLAATCAGGPMAASACEYSGLLILFGREHFGAAHREQQCILDRGAHVSASLARAVLVSVAISVVACLFIYRWSSQLVKLRGMIGFNRRKCSQLAPW